MATGPAAPGLSQSRGWNQAVSIYPKRIVCLAAELPDIFYRLGALERVVGISAYTRRPAAALGIPRVSGFPHGDVRRILRQRPDMVMLTSGVQRELGERLAAAGVTLVHLNPHRLADLYGTVHLVGRLVGRETAARALVRELFAGFAQIRARGQRLARHPRVYVEQWPDPLICGTGWVSDLVTLAGGVDVLRNRVRDGRSAPARTVRWQDVLATAPDLMLASWCGEPLDTQAVRRRPGWTTLSGVAAGGLYAVDSEILQCGPILLDAAWKVLGLIERHAGGPGEPRAGHESMNGSQGART